MTHFFSAYSFYLAAANPPIITLRQSISQKLRVSFDRIQVVVPNPAAETVQITVLSAEESQKRQSAASSKDATAEAAVRLVRPVKVDQSTILSLSLAENGVGAPFFRDECSLRN